MVSTRGYNRHPDFATAMKFELNPFHYNVPDRELLDDLRRVAGELSVQSLSQAQYGKHGKFSPATFKKRFLTWNKALSAAGLLLAKRAHVPSQEMLAELRRVATITGGSTLTRAEYAQHGLFSAATISKRFGIWEKC